MGLPVAVGTLCLVHHFELCYCLFANLTVTSLKLRACLQYISQFCHALETLNVSNTAIGDDEVCVRFVPPWCVLLVCAFSLFVCWCPGVWVCMCGACAFLFCMSGCDFLLCAFQTVRARAFMLFGSESVSLRFCAALGYPRKVRQLARAAYS